MAAVAKFRDDIAGAIVTSGTSTAYTVASFSVFDSFAHMDKQVIAFSPHATNAVGPVSLNVDGLGTRVLRSSPGVDLPAGVLIQGTPYVATYSNADTAWYLQNFFGNPYNIPLAGGIDYWGPTAPNASFALPFGQAISRTTYATLFALVGSTFGAGDGSTTFNLPDKRGRMTASPDNMGGGTDPNRLTSGSLAANRNSVGGVGGTDTVTLSATQIPAHSHPNTLTDPGHFHSNNDNVLDVAGATKIYGTGGGGMNNSNLNTDVAVTGISINNANNTGGGGAHDNMPPTILCNYIMRII